MTNSVNHLMTLLFKSSHFSLCLLVFGSKPIPQIRRLRFSAQRMSAFVVIVGPNALHNSEADPLVIEAIALCRQPMRSFDRILIVIGIAINT